MKSFFILWFSLIWSAGDSGTSANQAGSTDYPHYRVTLSIDPLNRTIEVNGSLELPADEVASDTLTFYLDRGMEITRFTLNLAPPADMDTSKSDNRFMPFARKIKIITADAERGGQPDTIHFSYHGELSELPEISPSVISPQWTEIGLYHPWFPFSMDQIPQFTYDLRVETGPGFEAFGFGKVSQNQDYTMIQSFAPTTDIVVGVSEDIHLYSSAHESSRISVYHQGLSESLLKDISADILHILDRYNTWFGTKEMHVTLIASPRETGGGYARRGGMVLTGLDSESYHKDPEGFARYSGHELAHLWWFKADPASWQDWLNESFAEYSALLLLRATYSHETFEKRIAKKQAVSAGTPPVWEFDRMKADHQVVEQVLYNKGPVLLYELEKEIGYESFMALCRAMITNDINTTSALLMLIEEREGKAVAESFETSLKTK